MSEERERTPVRWDPFSELDPSREWGPFRGFGRGMPRLFGDVHPRALANQARFAPPVDIAENDSAYVITAELPGTQKDDVTVEVHDNVITIRGEKRSERTQEKEHSRYIERSFGTFSRSFTLPANAQSDRIEAGFRDGVLTLEIPKAEERQPRVVKVRT